MSAKSNLQTATFQHVKLTKVSSSTDGFQGALQRFIPTRLDGFLSKKREGRENI